MPFSMPRFTAGLSLRWRYGKSLLGTFFFPEYQKSQHMVLVRIRPSQCTRTLNQWTGAGSGTAGMNHFRFVNNLFDSVGTHIYPLCARKCRSAECQKTTKVWVFAFWTDSDDDLSMFSSRPGWTDRPVLKRPLVRSFVQSKRSIWAKHIEGGRKSKY